MIDISYTFEVVRVDPVAKVMEVVYTATGHQPIIVGARLPVLGESVESVVRQFAPWGIWEEATREYAEVPVGVTGSLRTVEPAPAVDPNAPTEDPFAAATDPAVLEAQALIQADAIRAIVQEVINGTVV